MCTLSFGSNSAVPNNLLLVSKLISAPLSTKKCNLCPWLTSRSKVMESQRSLFTQPAEYRRRSGGCSPAVLPHFPDNLRLSSLSFLRAGFRHFRAIVTFLATLETGNQAYGSRSASHKRVYSSFPLCFASNTFTRVTRFSAVTTPIRGHSSARQLSCLDAIALSSTRAVSSISSKFL